MTNALVCVSSGGPVTSVTWTRNDTIIISNETKTVLKNAVTAEYIHTLTVTEGQTGIYRCTVNNNEQSAHSTSVNIQGCITL